MFIYEISSCGYHADYTRINTSHAQRICVGSLCDLWNPTAAQGITETDRQCCWNKLNITYLQMEVSKGLKRAAAVHRGNRECVCMYVPVSM